jgi:hypothetical protein
MEGIPKNGGFHFVTFHVIVAKSVTATGYGLDDRDSIPNKGKVYLFSTGSRVVLGPNQPPLQ